MQQPVSRRDIYEPVLTVNGRGVEVESASTDRALPDPLARGQLRAASAQIVAVEGPDVTETVATPWDPGTQWPPVPQSPASVSMDTGSGPVSLLGGGLVVSAEGGTSGREVEVEVADRYESLNRTISWDNVAAHMPSLEEGEYGRYVGMTTTSITDAILEHCGWYSTPPSLQWNMLRVPAQGSMWPSVGSVELSNNSSGSGYPRWLASQWGVSAADVDTTYRLGGSGYSLASHGGFEMTAMTQAGGESSSGTMYLDARSDDWSARLRLQWDNNVAYLRFWDGSNYQNAAILSRSDGLLYATIRRLSATSVEFTLRSGSAFVTNTMTVPSALTSRTFAIGRVWGLGRGGGFQFAAPSVLGTLENWVPNAVLYPRLSNRNALDVRPSVEGENCADLLAAQCEAECATYWIDETGVLRWWDLRRLEERSSVATLTSDDDIAEAGFTWSHNRSQVKSRVSVKWRAPLQDRSWRTTVDLWQGSGKSVSPGTASWETPSEMWINVPDDEVWVMPDLTMTRVGDAGSMEDFNYGFGSHYGAVVPSRGSGADTWVQFAGWTFSKTLSRVTDRAFKMSTVWTGNETIIERTPGPESSTALWHRRLDMDLPIVRGKLKFMMADQVTYSSQSGPSTAPEHEIDAGWWIQSEEQAQYTADYAGERLTVPQPVLSSVALIPVPGLQLGDVVEVRDLHRTRLTVRGIVIEDSRSINADMGMSHQVAIRPTYVTRNGVTWQEWASAARPKTWAQWAQNQDSTWTAWGAAPLLKESVI